MKGQDGKFLYDQGLRDAFGHAQLGGVAPVIAGLVKNELNLKYHWAVADYLQRAARHVASKTGDGCAEHGRIAQEGARPFVQAARSKRLGKRLELQLGRL